MEPAHDSSWLLSRGLAGYLRAVAEAVGVPVEGTGFEISDTATAYLGLSSRWTGRPSRDLMLVWSERHGWSVAVETDPEETPHVLADLGGGDVIPAPQVVATFVADVVAERYSTPGDRRPIASSRVDLAERLHRYVEVAG
jgi:hypothetical protein